MRQAGCTDLGLGRSYCPPSATPDIFPAAFAGDPPPPTVMGRAEQAVGATFCPCASQVGLEVSPHKDLRMEGRR